MQFENRQSVGDSKFISEEELHDEESLIYPNSESKSIQDLNETSEPESQEINFIENEILEEGFREKQQDLLINMPETKSRLRPKRMNSQSIDISVAQSYHGLSNSQSDLGGDANVSKRSSTSNVVGGHGQT